MIRMSLTALAAGFLIAASPADAQRRSGGGGGGGEETFLIELYDGPDYTGRSIRLDGEAPDLSRLGFNDITTGIRITGGPWEVCIDANYRGACEVVTESRPDITPWSFNNRISSVRPVRFRGRGAEAGVTLYSGPDYTGRSVTLIEPVDDFRRIYFNDMARSIRVHSGTWVLCQDNDFEDNCREFDRDVSDLRRFNLDRSVSSALPLADFRRRSPHPGGYGPGPGYGPPPGSHPGQPPRFGGRTGVDGGVRGRTAEFFPEPRINGYFVSACRDGFTRSCGQPAADALCRAAGRARAAYYATSGRRGEAWLLDERRPGRSDAVLIDVACIN